MNALMKLAACILLFTLTLEARVQANEMKTVAFSDVDELQKWLVVSDTVMGGVSHGQFLLEDNNGIFFGVLSLENNGGFASIRRLFSGPVSEPAAKISIRVKGDGGRFQFRVRTNRNFDGYAYQVSFNTIENEWVTLYFEPEDFIATYRGMVLNNVPALDFSDIEQIGFLISEKQQGEFALHIHTIKFLQQ
ncbi:CIA30 family protein [Thalassotalea sp. PS06]|uniref:CIA30 family protein n=1 Tax=Thalassotalea sp. PS06 TaxID=2594005 RepID=UPI001162EB4C|nr:CIA30 family protein [Thalassotalea sp. PS06]QDP01018.1 CIA30 family protein [Thalassotalea sp. PS06]